MKIKLKAIEDAMANRDIAMNSPGIWTSTLKSLCGKSGWGCYYWPLPYREESLLLNCVHNARDFKRLLDMHSSIV